MEDYITVRFKTELVEDILSREMSEQDYYELGVCLVENFRELDLSE